MYAASRCRCSCCLGSAAAENVYSSLRAKSGSLRNDRTSREMSRQKLQLPPSCAYRPRSDLVGVLTRTADEDSRPDLSPALAVVDDTDRENFCYFRLSFNWPIFQ